MSPELMFILGAIGLIIIVGLVIKCVRIIPECPHCEEIGEIYDSSVSEAWLDCMCLSCGYKWRIE